MAMSSARLVTTTRVGARAGDGGRRSRAMRARVGGGHRARGRGVTCASAKPRALVSVSDKEGMTELASGRVGLGYEIVSTGGTREGRSRARSSDDGRSGRRGIPRTMGSMDARFIRAARGDLGRVMISGTWTRSGSTGSTRSTSWL